MTHAPQALPSASLLERSVGRRLLARLLQPPRWARTRSTWAISAGFAAGALHMLSALLVSGDFGSLYEIGKPDLETLIGTCIGILVVTFAFFIPLWCSAGLYVGLFRPRRRTAVIWCVAFHVLAHIGLIALFNASPRAMIVNIHVPLLIAGLWGLWLPGTEEEAARNQLSCR